MESADRLIQISQARISTPLGDDPTEGFNRWNNSLTTRALQKTKRFPWLLTTLKGRPTNGGSGFQDVKGRKTCDFMGEIRRGIMALFGPSRCEDFDEALSRIKQLGTLIGHDDLRGP
ncbi:hypothetical protein CK203_093811 [Vitis vinifera]|uniref:Uncharacterized protein n=1 Tax=Vitis vinifera TaxID=29760 RepID=A0A438C7R0_VITVI|nr:hypothetical protein CK203_093811 [Vitis vinifera]